MPATEFTPLASTVGGLLIGAAAIDRAKVELTR